MLKITLSIFQFIIGFINSVKSNSNKMVKIKNCSISDNINEKVKNLSKIKNIKNGKI